MSPIAQAFDARRTRIVQAPATGGRLHAVARKWNHRTQLVPGRHGAVTGVELAIVAVIAGIVIAGAMWPRTSGPRDVFTAPVRIEAGQTLWTLAQEYPVAGLTTEQTADLIASVNAIDGPLRAGSVVRVPAQRNAPSVAMR